MYFIHGLSMRRVGAPVVMAEGEREGRVWWRDGPDMFVGKWFDIEMDPPQTNLDGLTGFSPGWMVCLAAFFTPKFQIRHNHLSARLSPQPAPIVFQ